MKTLHVARKYLLEFLRDPTLLALSLLTPIAFILITYVGYGTAPKLATYPILVIDSDHSAASEKVLNAVRAERHPDNRPVFEVRLLDDRQVAESELKAKHADILMILTSDPASPITVRGDGTSMRFIIASTLLETVLNQVSGIPRIMAITEHPISVAAPASEFDAYTPGMMIFAVLLLTPQTSMLVARELRSGTLRRLRISHLRAWELMMGVTLAQMLVAVGQVVLMFVAALALGFHNRGSLLLAILIGLLLSFSAIGWGLIVTCFSQKDSDALNVGSVVTMLQVFLSGAFFPIQGAALFSMVGHEIGLFDFIPATHGMLALQQVLIGGIALDGIIFRLGAMIVLSITTFGVGILMFARIHMRRAV